jgi:glycosyltransferase involved in cell wall biosynthesis
MKRKPGTRPLRIVLYEPAGRSGICHYTWELAEHLAQVGNDVILLTTEDYELENLPRHFRVRYLFTRSWIRRLASMFAKSPPAEASSSRSTAAIRPDSSSRRRGLRHLRMRLLHLRAIAGFVLRWPDVVHFQWLADRERDLSLMRILRRLRIVVIYTAHDVLPLEGDSWEERAFRARLYRAPDGIIVHTEADRQSLADTFGVPLEDIAVVPHGAYDFRFGRTRTIEKPEARRRLEIPLPMKVILFFGLIKRYKGLEYLVSAFDLVEKQREDVVLLVVGDVYRGDVQGYRYYTDLVATFDARNNVRAVIGYVPVGDIPMYFAAADVVVLPYTHTSQSGVLLTAYGSGRPVIVTDTGSLPEIVERGRTGLVIPPRDPEAIARAVVSILADPARAREMGKRARELGATVYSWSSVAQRTVETYILAGSRRGQLRARGRESLPSDESWTGTERS